MNPVLIYCYDAYCGWCYGFSPVIKKIEDKYRGTMQLEVLSGGLVNYGEPQPISAFSELILGSYKRIEEMSSVEFGADFLWHVRNTDKSDWFLDSEKSSIALCIFKDHYPDRQAQFAADMEYAFNYEARDLMDDEAYRHLLEKYEIDADEFYKKLHSEEYKEKAHHEYALCKQLGITGFPCLLMQVSENKIYLISQGLRSYEDVKQRIEDVLKENQA